MTNTTDKNIFLKVIGVFSRTHSESENSQEPVADVKPSTDSIDECAPQTEPALPQAMPDESDAPDTPDTPHATAPEATIDLDAPQIRLTTSFDDNPGIVAGFSIQGRSHITGGIPCQDYHAYEKIADGWYLAIVSDGAGSARESERGSKANCDLAKRMVRQLVEGKGWIKDEYFPTELEWYIEIRNIFEIIQSIIVKSASSQADAYREDKLDKAGKLRKELESITDDTLKRKMEDDISALEADSAKPLESRDFNATIILLLITPKGLLSAHIGDGRMAYMNSEGKWIPLMTPHKGDEASTTVFIPNNWNRQQTVPVFTMSGVFLPEVHAIADRPKAFVLMSDGCENFTWNCYAFNESTGMYYDPNEPFTGFFTPLIDELRAASSAASRVERLIEIVNVGTRGGRNEHDDRTMIIGLMD